MLLSLLKACYFVNDWQNRSWRMFFALATSLLTSLCSSLNSVAAGTLRFVCVFFRALFRCFMSTLRSLLMCATPGLCPMYRFSQVFSQALSTLLHQSPTITSRSCSPLTVWALQSAISCFISLWSSSTLSVVPSHLFLRIFSPTLSVSRFRVAIMGRWSLPRPGAPPSDGLRVRSPFPLTKNEGSETRPTW